MEGRDAEQIKEKYHDLFKPALLTNWKIWPLAQVSYWQHLLYAHSERLKIAYKFPLHALALSCSIPISMRGILDALLVHNKCKVNCSGILFGLHWEVNREDEKLDKQLEH